LHPGEPALLNDDLRVVSVAPTLIASLPIDLSPQVVCHLAVPIDVEPVLFELLAAVRPKSWEWEWRL